MADTSPDVEIFPVHMGVFRKVPVVAVGVRNIPRTHGGVPLSLGLGVCHRSIFPVHMGVFRWLWSLRVLGEDIPRTHGGVPC